MTRNKLADYTTLLQQLLECFDYDEHNWPTVTVCAESGYTGKALVGEELADLLLEIRETLEDYGDE